MRKSTLGKLEAAPRLGMMIHEAVREAIERAVDEELEAALGAKPYARTEERRGYRNGFAHAGAHGPDGQVRDGTCPRGTMFTKSGREEWGRSKVLPRYSRRIVEVDEAVTAAYLSGANTRRIPRCALAAPPRCAAQQERRVARDRHAQGGVRRVEKATLSTAWM